jgi:hypothetical protein
MRIQVRREETMRRFLTGAALGAVAAATASPAFAHHGFGTYDLNADMEVTGTLVELDFVNPHSWLHIEAAGPDGEMAIYHCEMRAATALRRSGWSREMFTVGERITMTGSPNRRNPLGCYVGSVTFSDGSTIDRYGQITTAEEQVEDRAITRMPDGTLDLSGDWAGEQVVMTDPRGIVGGLVPLTVAEELDGEQLAPGVAPFPGSRGADPSLRSFATTNMPLTEKGRAATDAYDDLNPDDNPRLRCETTSIIFDWTFDPASVVHRISQTGDAITMEYGRHGFVRTIHLDMDAHPSDITPGRAGHSIGHWEGDELVVDTIGFTPGVLFPPLMHGASLHVMERFGIDQETGALRRTYAATDPEYFEGEYTGGDTVLPSAAPFAPDPCVEPEYQEYHDD